MKIPVQSIWGAEPFSCSTNVQKRIAAMGGKAVFGWTSRPNPAPLSFITVKNSHCVWEDPAGQVWDVTPVVEWTGHNDEVVMSWRDFTEFERDDAAKFEEKALPNKYITSHKNPNVIKACEYMEIADVYLHDGNIEKCRYWTDKANAAVLRAGINGGWDTPASEKWSDVLPTMLAG